MITGYGIEDFTWQIETTPGGPKVNVSGTIESVYSQLTKINPKFVDEYPPIEVNETSSALTKRDDILCGNWPDSAGTFAITQGISHLRGVSGVPTNGPGPGNCGRVSCSLDSAIWWCNDVSERYSQSNCSEDKLAENSLAEPLHFQLT